MREEPQSIAGPSDENRAAGMELTMPPRMLSYPRGVPGGVVPGTQEAHDGKGTSVSKGREEQEVSNAGRFL